MPGSIAGKFSWHDAQRLLRDLVVVLIGVLATFMEDKIPQIDFGTWAPIVIAVNTVIVSFLRRLFSNTVTLVALLALMSAFMAGPSQAGERVDRFGRTWNTDNATASTPGAGSGFGAVVGLAETGPDANMIDLRFELAGSGDGRRVAGVGVLYYPKATLRGGVVVSRSLAAGSSGTDVTIPIHLGLGTDPFTSTSKWLGFDLVRASFGDGVTKIRFEPGARLLWEIPQGPYALEFSGGLHLLGVSGDPELDPSLAGAFTYRLR